MLPAPISNGVPVHMGLTLGQLDRPEEEISAYAPRILNVHVKDRLLGGTTVPLGTGAADLAKTIRLIEQSGYRGQYVLQTARATDGDHPGVLARYRDMTVSWIEDAGR